MESYTSVLKFELKERMRFSPFFLKRAFTAAYKLPFFELARHNSSLIAAIPSRPVEAGINVTNNCNARCTTCSMWKQKSVDELTTTEIYSILAQLRDLGTNCLVLTGGEPLLRRDLSSIVKKATELKFKRIQVSTNALPLTKRRAQDLIESGVTTFYISLNGLKEVHDMTRGVNGSYEKCLAALRSLVELRDNRYKHLEIKVATIFMQPTIGEIPKLLDICRELNIELTLCPLDTQLFSLDPSAQDMMNVEERKLAEVINQLHKMARAYPHLIGDTHTSLEYAKNNFADPKREDIPCYLGYLAIYIGAHGEVYSGCYVLPPLGNMRRTPLKQIVNSTAYKQRRRDMFLKRCPGCTCGHRLNLYAHVPAVLEEIRWILRIKSIA